MPDIHVCEVCGKVFTRRKKTARTCSKVCGYKIRKTLPNSGQFGSGRKPWNYGKKMTKEYRKKMSLARIRAGCCKGPTHYKWRGGSRGYFKALAREKMLASNAPRQCAICGAEKNVHVHHKNKNWRDNRVENLIYLCASCHLKLHHRRDRTKNICAWCNKVFYSGRRGSKFCSDRCRGTARRAKTITKNTRN